MRKLNCSIAFILLLWPCCFLAAQETTSEIVGVIMDGKTPLQGAFVKAVHLPTGTRYTTVSRKDGRYNLANLKIGGPYTVTVNYIGYKEEAKGNISLLIGEEYKADFTLTPLPNELSAITVESNKQGKVFNNNHTGPQEIISREHFDNLPVQPRSLEGFTSLFPAANGLNIGGRNSLYNNITLDGANFSNVFGLATDKRAHIAGQAISIEGIEQVQVNIAPYDVRQGGFAGTNLNIVSRGGSNNFKGNLYSFYTGPGLTGYKTGNTELTKEQFTYNRTGFSFGGPIIKDKLFFFINAEREQFKEPATAFTASDAAHPSGENVSNVKAEDLNNLRQFLIDKFDYDPGLYQGYTYRTKKDRISAKIDWNIDTNTTLSFKYNCFNASKDDAVSNSFSPDGSRQPGITGIPFNGTGFTIFNNLNSFIAELNTNWKDDASNKLQIGYLALRNYRESMGGKAFPLVDIMNNSSFSTSFGIDPFTYQNKVHIDIFQFSDMFTLYKGPHEITFGTQNYIKRYKSGFAPYYAGVYRFKSLDDFYSSVENNTPNATSYILQYSIAKDGAFPYTKIDISELSFFAQDKTRFKNELVLTYGLRADIPVFGNTFPANPHVSSLTFRDGKHYDVGEKPAANVLISPRVSFNWDVTKNVKTQLRGGAGLFAGPPPLVWLSNIASNNGAQLGFLRTKNIAFSPDITKYVPYEKALPSSYELALVDKNFKYPQVFKTNMAVDRLLPGGITASLELTYMKDINTVYFQNVNLPSTGTAFAGSDNRLRYSSTQINAADETEQSPENPNIEDAILMTNSSKGYSYIMTLQLQKRISNFYFGASYAYSKTRSVNDGGALQPRMWSARPVKGDPNSEELGYADFYMPNRFLAFGSFRKAYAKYFTTSISFIFEAAPSGVGSYTYRGDLNNDGALYNNDLIYIPKDQTDIVLVPVGTGSGNITDHRTPAQIWAQLDNYISQDKYLSEHRGEYAKRNAVVFPFFKRLDLSIAQEFILGNGTNTIRLSFDLINVGNFLNKNWGAYKTFNIGTFNIPYISSILKYEEIEPGTGKPRFSFPYLDPANEIPLTNSFKDDDASIFSRWQGQFGIRYTF